MTDNSRNKARIRRVYDATLTNIESMISQPNRVQLHIPTLWHQDQWERYVKADLISRKDVQFLHSRITVAMRLQEFVGLNVDGNWRVSFDKLVNLLFNAMLMRECFPLLEKVNATEMILQSQDRFSILLGRSSDSVSDETWKLIGTRIADPIYRDNSINTKTLLHFFFAYLLSGAQLAKYWKGIELFDVA